MDDTLIGFLIFAAIIVAIPVTFLLIYLAHQRRRDRLIGELEREIRYQKAVNELYQVLERVGKPEFERDYLKEWITERNRDLQGSIERVKIYQSELERNDLDGLGAIAKLIPKTK